MLRSGNPAILLPILPERPVGTIEREAGMAITKDKRRTTIEEVRGSVKPLPPSRFESPCRAPAERVYDLLSDLSRHLEWGGERQGETTRLLTMESPPGPATVGTEFRTTGSDGKVARWHDRSVVTEATRPSVFEFVTEGVRHGKPGSTPMEATTVHRYEIVPTAEGCLVTYQGQVTRYSGFPRVVRAPLIGRWLLAYAAKFMGKGFDALIALAEEEAAPSPV